MRIYLKNTLDKMKLKLSAAEIVDNIGSSSGSKRLTNIIRARKLLLVNSRIKEFLKAGIISSIIPCLKQQEE